MTESVLSYQPNDAFNLPEGHPRDEATLALFGHDLRAALSDVVGGLRLVAPEALDTLNRAQIDRVRVSAEVLARLLEQGLAVMLGEVPAVRPEVLNVQRFLTDLDLRWSGRALEKGIAFSLHKGQDLPIGLKVDSVALDRVLSNLLGNAFKYCRRGRVICDVALRADGGLRWTVRDDGPGFPASVFDKNTPVHKRPDRVTELGSGMGLHIAADLTHRMGGQLTLRNLVASGAEAQMDLPMSASAMVGWEPAEVPLVLAGKRVLIADDNPTSQAIVARLATGIGAEVVVVGDGVETIERLEREPFDLLIVDVEMPRMSGLDVIRCLRLMPAPISQMPVIAVTAYGLPSDRRTILAAGANDLFAKPLLCPHAFAAVVRGVLMPQSGTAEVQSAPPVAARPKAPALDRDRLFRLLEMAGPETGRDLLDRLISDLSGVQRGLMPEVPQPGAEPDWAAIRSHSHVLISLAGAVGGLHLQAEAEALNMLGHRMDQAALGGLLTSVLIHLNALIEAIGQVRQTYLVQSQ